MLRKKLMALLAAVFALFACCSCAEETVGGGFDKSEYDALPEIRFASFYGTETESVCKLKMVAPYSDTYAVSFSASVVQKVEIYDADGKKLVSSEEAFEIELEENELVYVNVTPVKGTVRMNVSAKEHIAQLPFDPVNAPDVESFSVYSDSDEDPLTAAQIEYVKREGGLYVYSNTPENIVQDVINKALTRQDISNREVFFTFEHASGNIKDGFYYGYQVRNTGTEDMYVTVKNIGLQFAGPGSYFGEKEWTSFYNTKFNMPDISERSAAKQSSFAAWFNFCGTYVVPNYQPQTYRIPAGEHIYVIGGTTADAYNHYNVADTADQKVNGNCQNGAVLFEVIGRAEGAFYVYDDPEEVQANNTTHVGVLEEYGRGYNGTDEGIVVDCSAVWTFNDKTESQSLPVTFTNYYKDGAELQGEAYSAIDSTPHEITTTEWWTHSNVQGYNMAVGTDMTSFHTLDPSGNEVVFDNDHYDGTGKLTNIGNWMKDYFDTYTFVNQGDRDREVTVKIITVNGGSLAIMVRDQNGAVIEGTPMFTFINYSTEYGEALFEDFTYTATVKAHSVLQFHVEYNLMANSYGSVTHEVILT